MKILIGITYYYPNISGVSLYAKRLAEGLTQKGHQVTVITSRHLNSLPTEEEINQVKVIRVPVNFKIGKGVLMFRLPFVVFKEAKTAQIINCHLPQFESFVFALIGKLLRKKVFLTHHTDLSGWKGILNRISEASVWFGQLFSGFLCDKIIPYTKDYADHSWYLRLFKNKLTFVLPPIYIGQPAPKVKKEIIQKIGKTGFVIGFAGRIAKQKGIQYLLKTIPYLKKTFPKFKIVFAGPYKEVIGEKYYEEISSLINQYQDYLVFLGPLPEEKMASFYSLCDVLVLPSHDRLESFGLVQAEAMLCRCPVVATNLPGARVPVSLTGMGEIVPPKKPKLLAKAIIKVLKNKKNYLKNYPKAKKIFNPEQTILSYEKLFSQS